MRPPMLGLSVRLRKRDREQLRAAREITAYGEDELASIGRLARLTALRPVRWRKTPVRHAGGTAARRLLIPLGGHRTFNPLRVRRPITRLILEIDCHPAVYLGHQPLAALGIRQITKGFCIGTLTPGGDILRLRRLIIVIPHLDSGKKIDEKMPRDIRSNHCQRPGYNRGVHCRSKSRGSVLGFQEILR